ncbi:cytochrome P450 [Streptomyces sp. NPDC018045]|uniref:cytochrome P450 n=1 Tax=Streptomyces sp. NPDC018045 TaxID=3365037 RepID=UPI0037882852
MPQPSEDPASLPPQEAPPPIELPLPPPGTMGPPTEYVRLRRECPVARLRDEAAPSWFVTRYDDVRAVIGDARLTRPSVDGWSFRPEQERPDGPELITMMEMEGPRHTALRRALSEAFNARSVRRRRPRIRRSAERLLDAFADGDRPGDLIAGYTEPFPLLVVCESVGIPYEDREYYLPLADAALGALLTVEEARRVTPLLRDYVRSLIARKRRLPAADILSDLVRRCDRGELDEESVLSFGLSMLVAGYRTTTMFLSDAIVALLTEPGRYARLRDDRSLLPGAVEEFLRYVPVMNGVVVLQATEDIELGGQMIRAGDAVLPALASANRDETVFDAPEQLDLCRRPNPHIVFGRGAHNCIGAHLARAELTVGLEALLDRFPHLRLAEGHSPTWDDDSPAKSPLTLPVCW